MFKRKSVVTKLKEKFRIEERVVRDQSIFTVEYRIFKLLFLESWETIMVCESLEDCERRINLLVNIKLNED